MSTGPPPRRREQRPPAGTSRQRQFRREARPGDILRRLAEAEIGAIRKPFGAQTALALVYPNSYSVGMSSLGFQTLAGRVNRRADAACERFFHRLDERDRSAPRSIENARPLAEFPLVAFSVSFELDYPNVVDVLHRSGIPLRHRDRGEGDPIVIAGGLALTMNRLPLYDFLDVIVHGDGEEAMDALLDARQAVADRSECLERLAALPGFEVPALRPEPSSIPPTPLTLADRLDAFPCCSTILTPHTEFALRGLIEISRGCPYRCAFCIMGGQSVPYNARSVEAVLDMARRFKPHTDRVGLVASAVGAHRDIETICEALDALDLKVSFSSLRVEDVKPRMIESLLRSGQRMVTIAPEAGNDSLRRVLNKNLSDERIEQFVASVFARGMESLKLYYMIGIPGETEDDVLSIARLTERLHHIQVEAARGRGHIGELIVNLGVYVPKPGTALASGGFCGIEAARRKIQLVKTALRHVANLALHCESPREAALQAFLSLGGRDCAEAIERAVLSGSRIVLPE
jgi:radical SAM superfamily enzyme YgiQ (UPF0313 family)